MSSTAKVWVNKDTRVICQGFTGKQVGCLFRLLVVDYGLFFLVCAVDLQQSRT